MCIKETSFRNVREVKLIRVDPLFYDIWGEGGKTKSSLIFKPCHYLVDGCSASRPDHFTTGKKNPCYPLYGKLGVLQSRSGHFGENNLTAFSITSNYVALWDQ